MQSSEGNSGKNQNAFISVVVTGNRELWHYGKFSHQVGRLISCLDCAAYRGPSVAFAVCSEPEMRHTLRVSGSRGLRSTTASCLLLWSF